MAHLPEGKINPGRGNFGGFGKAMPPMLLHCAGHNQETTGIQPDFNFTALGFVFANKFTTGPKTD